MTPDMVNRAQMFDSYFMTPLLVIMAAGIVAFGIAFIVKRIKR